MYFKNVYFFKKKHARGPFAAVEALLMTTTFGDIFCIKGIREFPKRASSMLNKQFKVPDLY
jgi:hypothetical protein